MPMKLQSLDTAPEIEALQIKLLAKAGIWRRLDLAWAYSASIIGTSRRWLTNGHPEWDEREVLLQWANIAYGEELARSV